MLRCRGCFLVWRSAILPNMTTEPNHTGVWAPWADDTPLEDNCAAVCNWLLANAANTERRLTVVPEKPALEAQPSISQFAKNGNYVTPKGRNQQRPRTGGPVLAFVPDDKGLHLAIQYANNQVIGLVEWPSPRMEGWAAAVRALNVTTGERHPGVDDDTAELLDDLYSAGYKGYSKSDKFVMAQAQPALTELLARGLDADFIVSFMIAKGMSDSTAASLRKLIG